jgi:hypothetical protein
MTRLTWDDTGKRQYETGVDRGVLFPQSGGIYPLGVAWNGLVTLTEKPSGAEATAKYADNIKYLNLVSVEEFSATLEAFTYPDAWAACDGSAVASPGVWIGQQNRQPFGLSYRSQKNSDVSYGYKLHLVYGGVASPSEKAFGTVNDTPDAITFSWDVSTTPVAITSLVNGQALKPSAILTVDSNAVSASALASLETILYGSAGVDPRLPLPDEVIALFSGTVTNATPTAPVYTSATHTITIPTVTGVIYRRSDTNAIVTGSVVLTVGQQLVIYSVPAAGYTFPANTDDDWQYNY